MKNKKPTRLVFALLGVFLAFYVVYQVYMAVSPAYETEVALLTTVSDGFSASGIVARDETVISDTEGGVVAVRVSDGEKIAAGAVVADVYATAADALADVEYADALARVTSLQSIASEGRTTGARLASLQTKLYSELSELSEILSSHDFSSVMTSELELTSLMSGFATASGSPIDITPALQKAESELASLSDISPASEVVTPSDGYFIAHCDGYENLVTAETLTGGDAGAIIAIIEENSPTAPQGSAGKIVSDYKWYYAAVIDEETAERLTVGKQLSVSFSYAVSSELPMKVVRVAEAADGRYVAVLSCDRLNSSLCNLRVESAYISFGDYSGIKVPRSALRLLNDELGVYIKYGGTAEFRTVDVVYETDDWVISSVDAGDSSRLAVYDEMITSGRDIYEGRQLGR